MRSCVLIIDWFTVKFWRHGFPFTKSSTIVIVDDHVASDLFRETVIKMAVPREIEVIISNVEDFANQF